MISRQKEDLMLLLRVAIEHSVRPCVDALYYA
jgi:hypothetical protein